MAKKRKRKKLRRSQRDFKSLNRNRLLKSPFYFEDRRYFDDRRKTDRPTKKEILSKIIRSKEVVRKSPRRGTRKYKTDRQRDRTRENIRFRVCSQRKERREVLFSLGKAGKGKDGPRKRILTEKSKVRC